MRKGSGRPIAQRLAEKLVEVEGHLLFDGPLVTGYGKIWDPRTGDYALAHRIAWELANGYQERKK